MKVYNAVIERCPQTGLFVGYVPGFPGAHAQGRTLDELHRNLAEVITMLLEDGEPKMEYEFIGVHQVAVA
ncbi:MAG: type II toxin-antitoxin system HicB family antitoxin [Tepidiphilus sp.]|jgi:predicted RNase H-like HicB family nuclease|nr:type II toxin-antitoxin system HicB family antitoxin [Tepidiphilus sp.]MDD3432569.1 type II toxin-antitoxin system HicB family antitoxin [Tepidiphilus sp.]